MDSPELQFGIFVYEFGTMLAEQTLTVKGITIENEGYLSGVEHLVIGPLGKITLRYCIKGESVVPDVHMCIAKTKRNLHIKVYTISILIYLIIVVISTRDVE
ncbi:hypothetical protein DPMN_003950 [Dreissena polymorpha]|uniref:Uncharacterized protein n=1 Tax=Dreissena polymorpha TaxID=45954 RepID=A0A9D4MMP9_DREPO|nr:hypothetical protein DPMN_003950 [Dreissena polymorpha]